MWGYRAFRALWGEGEAFLEAPQQAGGYGLTPVEYPAIEALCAIHRAPAPHHGCGYYFFRSPGGAALYGENTGFMAQVWAYGRIMEHLDGGRSQFLQVVAIYEPFCMEGDDRGQPCRQRADFAVMQGGGWRSQLKFSCARHRRDALGIGSSGTRLGLEFALDALEARLVPVEMVLESLATRLHANVFGFDQTERLLELNRSWRAPWQAEAPDSVLTPEEREQRRRERDERDREDAARRKVIAQEAVRERIAYAQSLARLQARQDKRPLLEEVS